MAHRYYCPPENISADKTALTFTGDEAAHLSRVLRAKPGQRLTAFDGAGMRYECTVNTVGPEAVACTVDAAAPGDAEPDVAVTLYVGYPKSDKLELIIQKAVELGAVRIVPFFSRFCVTAPKKEEQKNGFTYATMQKKAKLYRPTNFKATDLEKSTRKSSTI